MKNTPPSAQTELEIHKPVIETMKKNGFGLLKDGETFYKLGYELDPRGNTTFTMSQAYEIHKALASERTRLLSVESMKMEERELNPNGRDLQIAINNREKESRNALRQSILSEMEKGSV